MFGIEIGFGFGFARRNPGRIREVAGFETIGFAFGRRWRTQVVEGFETIGLNGNERARAKVVAFETIGFDEGRGQGQV